MIYEQYLPRQFTPRPEYSFRQVQSYKPKVTVVFLMLTFIFIWAEIEIMGTKLYPNLEYNHYQQARADFNVVKDI